MPGESLRGPVGGCRLERRGVQPFARISGDRFAILGLPLIEWLAFPRTTVDAVRSGIVAALCGTIAQQHARLAETEGTTPRCLLTGGDAEAVLSHLKVPAEHVPVLVLEGIDCVARGPVSS